MFFKHLLTRKVNGDLLQSRVKNTVGPWKAGRFMPLTLRPFSANNYALSKVWFKCSSINLRTQDIDNISSQVKSWLYQDCFEKPNELVLYRESHAGGLGLFHVKTRSLALLIRSFMETACNPAFRHNLLHEILFRYHVLGEVTLPNPGFLPYYDQEFFSTIKHYKQNCPLNITVMSTKQWYRALLEDRVLMQAADNGSPQALLPVRVELLSPASDWQAIWPLSRTKGLSSEQCAFLFKLLHLLLPTQDRINRITDEPGLCKLCKTDIEDAHHALYSCQFSHGAASTLMSYLQITVPDTSSQSMLKLDFRHKLDDKDSLATLSILSTGFQYIWQARADKKVVNQYRMRAEIEASISILRKTRFAASADKMLEMII